VFVPGTEATETCLDGRGGRRGTVGTNWTCSPGDPRALLEGLWRLGRETARPGDR
jgi:hypothetical protein